MGLKSTVLKHISISLLFITGLIFYLSGCAGSGVHASENSAPLSTASLEDVWGVRDFSIRMAKNGYILDFRYHVTDPDRARPLFDSRINPYLVDDETGARFYVPVTPKLGAMRTTRPPKADKTYFILFGNPGQYLKVGSRVTVVIGDFKAEHLVVQ